MSYYENSRKTFAAGAAIAHQSVVKLGAAGVEACGADGTPLGFVEIGARAAGELVSVRLINTPGTVEVRAGGNIPAGHWSARERMELWTPKAARLSRSGLP